METDTTCTPEAKRLVCRDKSEADFKRRTLWRSGCVECDKRAVLFFSQFLLSVAVIAFCIVMMVLSEDCEKFSRYSPVLTFMLGIWFPQPQMREM